MKTSVAKLLGIVLGVVGITAILAGCSQGFVGADGGTPSNSASSTQPLKAASAPSSTAAIAGPTSKSNVAYRPKPLKAEISGSNVSVSVGEVERDGNANFYVSTSSGNMSFMVYRLDGKEYVRADICPPCGSRSFTLQNGRLTCNSCGTVFDATTGAGIKGACVAYPKASVPYVIADGNIVMTVNDLFTAYQNTLNRKG